MRNNRDERPFQRGPRNKLPWLLVTISVVVIVYFVVRPYITITIGLKPAVATATPTTNSVPVVIATLTATPGATVVAPTTPPVQSSSPIAACADFYGHRGTDRKADGTNWTIASNGGGAYIVNIYFPGTSIDPDHKLLVPEGTTTLTFKGAGGSYWLWPMGCSATVQQNYNGNPNPPTSLDQLRSMGLIV